MDVQDDIFPVEAVDLPRIVEVWEASVRATHDFISEADIERMLPLVRKGIPKVELLFCMRAKSGEAIGFVGVVDDNVSMLFIHPDWRGQGVGHRLLRYGLDSLGATTVDVNEQNEQAVGFYLHEGFEVVGRSELDGQGKPFPLLHMRIGSS